MQPNNQNNSNQGEGTPGNTQNANPNPNPAPNQQNTQQFVPNPNAQQNNQPNQFQGPQNSFNGGGGNPNRNSLKIIIPIAVVVIILIIGGAMLVAGGSDDSNLASQDNQTSEQLSDEDLESFDSETLLEEEEAPVEQKKVQKINKTMDAKALGVKVTAVEVIRPLALINEYDRLNEPYDETLEYTLIKVKAENYGDYSVIFSPTTLDVETADGSKVERSYGYSKDELKEAGYEALESESLKKGESNVGYILYEAPKDSKGLTLIWDIDTKVLFGDEVKETYKLKLN